MPIIKLDLLNLNTKLYNTIICTIPYNVENYFNIMSTSYFLTNNNRLSFDQ